MKTRGKQKGFTLLEMMIVVAILGILAAMAYPSFQYTLAVNRAKYGESEINKALAYARSEAISRNKYIGICPTKSDAPELCTPNTEENDDCPSAIVPSKGCSWSNGFFVYVDNNINYNYDPTIDEIIQHFYLNEKPLILKLDTARLTWKAGGLALHPTGKNLSDQVIEIIPSNDPTDPKYLRKCTIAATGQTLCSVKEK